MFHKNDFRMKNFKGCKNELFMRFPDTHWRLISLVLSSWILAVLWEEQRKKVLVKANNIFMIADDVVYGPRGRGETKWKWKTPETLSILTL